MSDQPRYFVSNDYADFRRVCLQRGWDHTTIIFVHTGEFEEPENLRGVWREDTYPPHWADLLPSKYTDQSSPFYGMRPDND